MKNKLNSLWVVVVLLIISRLVVLGVGVAVHRSFDPGVWVQWDGIWYLQIVNQGYATDMPEVTPAAAICNEGTGACQRNVAFFPLYPLLVRGAGNLIGGNYALAGLLLSNLCFIGAGVLLFKLAEKLFNRRTAWAALLLFAFVPSGYIFSAVMTESLFVFLLIAAYFLAFNKQYLAAGFTGALLAATRNTGILFALPLLLVFLEQQQAAFRPSAILKALWGQKKVLLALFLVPQGLVLFMLHLQGQINDALAFIHIQSYWEKPVLGLNPFLAIPFSLIDTRMEGSWYIHVMNLVWVVIVFGLLLYSWRKRILKWSLNNILLWLLVPMSAGTLLAMSRYSAVLFPIYLIAGKLLAGHRKILLAVLAVSFLLLLIMSYYYAVGSWIAV